MFQMKFYAVALFRSRGVPPPGCGSSYLADGPAARPFTATSYCVSKDVDGDLACSIRRRTGDFRPNPSRLCDWCPHQQRCPAFSGTPPPYPGWPTETSGKRSHRSAVSVGPPRRRCKPAQHRDRILERAISGVVAAQAATSLITCPDSRHMVPSTAPITPAPSPPHRPSPRGADDRASERPK